LVGDLIATLMWATIKNKERTSLNQKDYRMYMRQVVVPHIKRVCEELSKKYPEISAEESV